MIFTKENVFENALIKKALVIGVKIDLLTEQAISPYLIDRIKAELKVIVQ